MSFVTFMSSPAGRAVRAVAGLAFIAWGVVDGILALVGLVPLAAGVFNVCLLGPLFKAPFSGKTLHSRPEPVAT